MIEVAGSRLAGVRLTILFEPRTAAVGRIRAWVKYGMTAAQVAQVYGVAVSEIERILGKP
jgi:hypothetical protein